MTTGRRLIRCARLVVAPLLLLAWLAPAAHAAPVPAPSPPAQPGATTPPSGTQFVKYLTVKARDGRVDYLWEISLRVLGDEQRYLEIFELNRGRPQPDGAAVTDPAVLREGWILVLPWDAFGDEVTEGTLPTVAPGTPDAAPTTRAPGGTTTVTGSEVVCTAPPRRIAGGVPWAQLRLAPEAAWSRGRGEGVSVAVIGSGVDATVPALAGRVLPGADTTSAEPASPADRDCTGHGTAMAGIVAAGKRKGTDFVGVAPGATIVPIRIRMAGGVADSALAARALRLAVSFGVGVAMIGAAVDTGDERIVAALRAAVAANTIVVVAAPAQGSAGGEPLPEGVLRVGAVGPDDRLIEVYESGAVDVVAPGVDVVSLGVGGTGEVEGTGTGYAVPFVAGVAALLRGSEPRLGVAEAAARIRSTADGGSAPDPLYGWGLVNPAAAVNAEPIREPSVLGTASTVGAIAAVVGMLALTALVIALRRRH